MKEAVEEDFPCLLLKSDLETTEIKWFNPYAKSFLGVCLLYTSDAADE